MVLNGTVVIMYGLIVLLGGLIGYLTAGSMMSLIMGSISGALLFASGLGLFRKSVIAFVTALFVSGLLTLFFTYRYYVTGKVTPALMMAGLSFIVFLLLLSTRGRPNASG